MDNNLLLALDETELLELDGGAANWFFKAVEWTGIFDAIVDFTEGFAKGYKDAWK